MLKWLAFEMEDDIRLFLNHLAKEKRCSKNTIDAYHNDLSQLGEYLVSAKSAGLRGSDLGRLCAEDLSHYMSDLREKGYTLSTVARKTAAARTFLKFMAERGKIKDDLAPNLAAPKVTKPLPHALSLSEVQRLFVETTRLPTADARRDRAMLEVLYATGMLASELMALNVDDVQGSAILVGRQKKRPRTVSLDRRVADIAREYVDSVRIKLLSKDKEKALFLNQRGERLTRQGFWQIVQGYADQAGLSSKVTPRTLRHSYAVHKLNAGADIETVRDALGHAHISTTKTYKRI
jgi:integrase/recombinase XerD